MLKSELVARLAAKYPNISVANIHAAVNQLIDMMGEALAQGRGVEIRGFGHFTLKHRPPRSARNPKTAALITTDENHAAHFKAGKALREQLNAEPETLV